MYEEKHIIGTLHYGHNVYNHRQFHGLLKIFFNNREDTKARCGRN